MKPAVVPSAPIKAAAVIILLALVFALNTRQIASHEDYRNSNFAKFWIAGHMVWTGLNPYDPAQWASQHHLAGATSVPDTIFLYPLPQAFFLVPLAWLPMAQSFLMWLMASQAMLALACYWLLNSTSSNSVTRLFVPFVLFLLFFGPVYLSLQIGSIGAIALVILVVSILLLNRGRNLLAGLLLSLLILKPSQGLPILALAGAWFLFRRNFRSIYGLLAGGVVLLLSGLIYDPQWIQKFLGNSQVVSAHTLGVQSNAYGFAYLACGEDGACARVMGTVAVFLLLALAAIYLWRTRSWLSAWEAFNLIIPVSFLSTLYLWSYDQLLYLIPIIWITRTLLLRTHSYVPVFAILIVLDVASLAALAVQAATHRDLLSVITTALVLGLCLWLQRHRLSAELQRDGPVLRPT